MFSNDQSVEVIGRSVDIYEHYIGLQTGYVKLDVAEKVVRPITVITLATTFSVIMMLTFIYVSFAVAYTLEPHVGLSIGFLIVAGSYLFVSLLFFLSRKQRIERPLVRFLASLLMRK